MATEIERKFLVQGTPWQGLTTGIRYRQGYIHTDPPAAVRIRMAGGKARLTIKAARAGLTRAEFEYAIPPEDAAVLLEDLCQGLIIEKTRYELPVGRHVWEVDVFEGANAGLVLAEIELAAEHESFARPPWLGAEVSGDPRYYNAYLTAHPFTTW